MLSLTSYQAPCALGEGRANGYMKELRGLGSAAFDIESSAAKRLARKMFRDNELLAVVFDTNAMKIDRYSLWDNNRFWMRNRPVYGPKTVLRREVL